MSTFSQELRSFADKIETIGEDGAEVLTRVSANPETKTVLGLLDELTGLNVAPGIISIVAAGLGELVSRVKAAVPAPAAEPAYTPAGPVVAGQA